MTHDASHDSWYNGFCTVLVPSGKLAQSMEFCNFERESQPKPRPVYKPEGTYLTETKFDAEDPNYTVFVDDEGLTVWSECCGDTMSRDTLLKVRDAINEYLEATA